MNTLQVSKQPPHYKVFLHSHNAKSNFRVGFVEKNDRKTQANFTHENWISYGRHPEKLKKISETELKWKILRCGKDGNFNFSVQLQF